jgi:hypothetical protein
MMRPWKKALVEDQDMHTFSNTYGMLLNETPPEAFVAEMKRIGKL